METEIKYLVSVLLLLFGGKVSSQELSDIVAEVSESIELDAKQSENLENHMSTYTKLLQIVFTKYEDEPDPKAMLSEIKGAKQKYLTALKNDLGKDKFKSYEGFMEQIQLELLGEAAGLRLMDLQDPISMTDEELELLKPIMAEGMRGGMTTLMQYVDKPLNARNKLKIASSLKSTKKTMDKKIEIILSPKQISDWEKLKEEAKKESS